jgi:predicted nucleic acid-binding protein
MATFLLDTSVIIDTLNNRRGRPAYLLELVKAGHVSGVLSHQYHRGLRGNAAQRTGGN